MKIYEEPIFSFQWLDVSNVWVLFGISYHNRNCFLLVLQRAGSKNVPKVGLI